MTNSPIRLSKVDVKLRTGNYIGMWPIVCKFVLFLQIRLSNSSYHAQIHLIICEYVLVTTWEARICLILPIRLIFRMS